MFSVPSWDEDNSAAGHKKKKKHSTPSSSGSTGHSLNAIGNSFNGANPFGDEPGYNESNKEPGGRKKHKKHKKNREHSDSKQISEAKSSSGSHEAGSLLRQGIKFSGLDDFTHFMDAKPKHHKSKKSAQKRQSVIENHSSPPTSDNDVSPAKKSNKCESRSPFDPKLLKEALFRTPDRSSVSKADLDTSNSSKAKTQLQASRFRYLNELLYTQTGGQSLKMFKNDPEAFKVYHQGYQDQLKKWPTDPLEEIINSIKKRSGNPVIADFGCGEARLARSLPGLEVHSFDLVALNDRVTVCDVANTPLEDESVDVVVFCLSLMGTNLRDYLREANRVLRMRGKVKIAEVESRFAETSVDMFVETAEKFGFALKRKNVSQGYFVFIDLKKVGTAKKKPPELTLKPCLYKKR